VKWFRSFVCDTSYAFTSTFLHCFCMICVSMTSVTCVLSTLIYSMSCHLLMIICFASAFTPIQMSFTLCTYAYFISYEYMSFGLEHISNPSPFVLIAIAYVNQAC
jgi:hypothetical protein